MLRSLKELEGYTVQATDGDIGKVENFLLDDKDWTVRYLVVQIGSALFLNRQQLLISPISFRSAEWSSRHFNLALTMDKIKSSPSIDMDKPVSRQNERDFYRHYGYPYYWDSSGTWGTGTDPGFLAASMWNDVPAQPAEASGDIHLRSAGELRGYHIQGSDEAIGHVEDFIVDDVSWEIHYLVIDTSNWWFGKKVLVAPQWARSVSWSKSSVYVDLSRQAVENSPEWNADAVIDREYETRLHNHYARPGYWEAGQREETKNATI